MKTKLYSLFAIVLFAPVLLFANIQPGDIVETKGKKSGIWFPGKVESIKGGKYYVISFGWENNGAQEIEKTHIRPLSKNTAVTIRKGGSVWAIIDPDGTIRINGSIAGSIDNDGTVRKGGSIVGSIAMNGEIWKNGSMKGSVWPTSEVYANGSIVGSIDNNDGTIRKDGSIWGRIDSFSKKFRDMRYALAILAFFTDEFGY